MGGNPSWNLVVQSVLEAWKEWQHREPMDQTELWVEESDGDDTRIRLLEVGTGDVGDGMMEGGAQVNVDKTYGRLQSRQFEVGVESPQESLVHSELTLVVGSTLVGISHYEKNELGPSESPKPICGGAIGGAIMDLMLTDGLNLGNRKVEDLVEPPQHNKRAREKEMEKSPSLYTFTGRNKAIKGKSIKAMAKTKNDGCKGLLTTKTDGVEDRKLVIISQGEVNLSIPNIQTAKEVGLIMPPTSSMRLLSWNYWGAGRVSTVRALKALVRCEGPKIIFVSETKAKSPKLEKLKIGLDYPNSFGVDCSGKAGGLALFWRLGVELEVVYADKNCIATLIYSDPSETVWLLILVYGPPYFAKKKKF